jgi:hypothetical protein
MPSYLSPGVYVEEVDGGSKPIAAVGTAVAAFVGFTQKGLPNTPTLVTNWTQFVDNFGDFMEGSYLAHSVYGYFNNGGGRAYIVRLAAKEGTEEAATPPAMAALPARAGSPGDTLRISGKSTPDEDAGIVVEISDATPPEGGEPAPDDTFKLTVRKGGTEEVFDNVTLRRGRGARNVETVVNDPQTGSNLITIADLSASGTVSERRPTAGSYSLVAPVVAGTEIAVSPSDFEGSSAARTGMGGLEAIDDVTMVLAPDLMTAYEKGMIDDEGLKAVQIAMIGHCERMGDRVAIIDPPPGLNAQQIANWRQNIAGYDSSYAALYYPWIKVFDPVQGKAVFMPPSGHMAGIWARTDNTRGVHKAPANEVVGGAIDLQLQITKGEQDGLNPIGVNCIRAFPGRGIRVWGARTLSSDPSWRYLNVRRLFNMVEKSIEGGTQWVVFEPNDFTLWQKIKRDVTSFLTVVWRTGALFGQAPGDAFFVKCDAETNPPEQRDLGMVVTEIGIAPVKPAEFVIFRISQYSPDLG